MYEKENILKLHEAIAVVLLTCKGRGATTDYIAEEINNRKLYVRKDQKTLPAYQDMQRAKLGGGRYHHLFKFSKPNIIKLR